MTFPDVAELYPESRQAIEFLVKAGYLRGRASGLFDPFARLTREEAALLTYRSIMAPVRALDYARTRAVEFFMLGGEHGVAYGMGFFINEHGQILTARHVVTTTDSGGEHVPKWRLYMRTYWGALRSDMDEPQPHVIWRLSGLDPVDLAVVQLSEHHVNKLRSKEMIGGDIPFLQFREPVEGEPVTAVGCPISYSNWVSHGNVAVHPIPAPPDQPLLLGTTAGINPGNSGGPLITADGYAVGVTILKPGWFSPFGGVAFGDDMGLALPTSEVRKWCERVSVTLPLA